MIVYAELYKVNISTEFYIDVIYIQTATINDNFKYTYIKNE